MFGDVGWSWFSCDVDEESANRWLAHEINMVLCGERLVMSVGQIWVVGKGLWFDLDGACGVKITFLFLRRKKYHNSFCTWPELLVYWNGFLLLWKCTLFCKNKIWRAMQLLLEFNFCPWDKIHISTANLIVPQHFSSTIALKFITSFIHHSLLFLWHHKTTNIFWCDVFCARTERFCSTKTFMLNVYFYVSWVHRIYNN